MYVLTSFDVYILNTFHFMTNFVKSEKSMKFTKFKIFKKTFDFGHKNHKIDFIWFPNVESIKLDLDFLADFSHF